MASQSVWGTIESQFLMQRLTLVGANLLFLWTLSPLGGQASLRLMNRGESMTERPATLRYMSSGPGSVFWAVQTTYSDNGKFSDAAALYSTALMAPLSNKLGPQDPWGNIKIPRLEQYNDSSLEHWHDVPADIKSAEMYSSLVGIPIVGLPVKENSTFPIEATYLAVDCSPFNQTYVPMIAGKVGNDQPDWTLVEKLVPGQVWTNKSNETDPFVTGSGETANSYQTSFFIDTDRPTYTSYPGTIEETAYLERFTAFLGNTNVSTLMNGNSSYREPRSLLYASRYPHKNDEGTFVDGQYDLSVTKCALTQSHVEVMVQCTGVLCAARKLRRSKSDTRSPNYTGLDHTLMMQEFARRFPFAIAPGRTSSSATERFLANSSDYPFFRKNRHSNFGPTDVYVDLAKVPIDVFSRRLSLVLNTYYQLTTQPSGYWGGLPTDNMSIYGAEVQPVDDINQYLPSNLSKSDLSEVGRWQEIVVNLENLTAPFIGAATTANITAVHQVFACQFAWLALLLTCSTVLLLTGAAAMVLKGRTLSPEVRIRLQNTEQHLQ